ncbi:toll/interleukin-1 receptor domain-containing protein [Lentzea sp. NPDC006480]|uniref:toll/interleukin-1 receptor domain-containing protein n=1 Tax=Lentzea sp. NPDC006480 TaxID=3157176 RepID=UPI0033B48780
MAAEQSEDAPIAFLSHASEDKDSFAEPLGRALAQLGVDPWLDKWEIKPGDSLVQKIFDEGLSRSQAVVVIISATSITKRWVREELDKATVDRIEHGRRLIPIRLDEVEMPAPLHHLVWINAERTPEGVGHAAARIADVLHGNSSRPAVAAKPRYVTSSAPVPGLTPVDSFLLLEVIREAMEVGQTKVIMLHNIKSRAVQAGLGSSMIEESLHALHEQYYVLPSTSATNSVRHVELTLDGYSAGISYVVSDIDEIHTRVMAALVNNPPSGTDTLTELAAQAHANRFVVDQCLHLLEAHGHVKASRSIGGGVRIQQISPTLRRLLP